MHSINLQFSFKIKSFWCTQTCLEFVPVFNLLPSSVFRDLQLEEYVDLYWRDYPSLISGFLESCLLDQSKTR